MSEKNTRLANMPISLFAVVMGLAGLALALQTAHGLWGVPALIGDLVAVGTLLVFLAVAAGYTAKAFRHADMVRWEFNHPIRLSFFPAISIALILLGIVLSDILTSLAAAFWAVGSLLHLIFTLVILSQWMHQERFEIHHSNPAWFIPIVGNILVPIAGVPLGFEAVSWFFFSVGLIFWLPLFAVLLNRYFFHSPMPAKLMPTLFILIAPPAVGFLSWMQLTGDHTVDAFGQILYHFALFITLLLFWQVRYFVRLDFGLPWWAYSFPMAAITVASMKMASVTGAVVYHAIAALLVIVLLALMILLVVRTILAAKAGKICVPE